MKSRAFTVVELMVSVVIVSILAGLCFPVFKSYRERAKVARCLSNVRGIGNALQIYAAENSSKLPGLTPDNVQIGPTNGTVDIRFELVHYDQALWNIICPSDPLQNTNPDPTNPVFVSYVYTPTAELDLGHADPTLQLVKDRGFFHPSSGKYQATTLFADGHVELICW